MDSPFYFDSNSDDSDIKNLAVINSKNTTGTGTSGSGGIDIYASDRVVIDNIRADSYIGIHIQYSYNVVVKNSKIISTDTNHYYGIRAYFYQDYEIKNNEISGYRDGARLSYIYQGLEFEDNYVHNNTSYGIYIEYSGNTQARSNPIEFTRNRLVDNYNGFYKYDSSSSYGYAFHIKDNLIKSSSWNGLFSNQYSREWIVENNTFDGDNDQQYGLYMNRYSYQSIFGNNTFSDHTGTDMYFYYCCLLYTSPSPRDRG